VSTTLSGRLAAPGAAKMDPAEWDARVKLAACYRMVARLGMDDLRTDPSYRQ
jgi:hypothetical protein